MRTGYLSCVFTLLAFSNGLAAEAVTFSGKIGTLSVIVELAKGKSGTFEAGRYAYMSKGVDIPLHVKAGGNGVLTISEEKPCTEVLCKGTDAKVADDAPMGATWVLEAGKNSFSGHWVDKENSKSLPVRLQQKGSRTIQDDGDSLEAIAPDEVSSGRPDPLVLRPTDLPYDFLKMDRPLKRGAVTSIGASSYRMDEDPRLGGLGYPTVLILSGGNPGPVNEYLAQQRLQFELSSFSCLSRAYLGLGWSGMGGEGSNGFDGGSQVVVNHLSSRLIGITESGSFDCGGAHPDNFSNFRLADARTGEALVPERLLRGWVAKDSDGNTVDQSQSTAGAVSTWGPSNELINYVRNNRDRMDDDSERECGYDELIGQNLGSISPRIASCSCYRVYRM